MKESYNRRTFFGVWKGVLLVLVGAIFALIKFDLLPDGFRKIVISWQMLLIVIGIVSAVRRHFKHGFCLIIIGGFAIVPRIAKVCGYDYFPDNFVSAYWPLALIAIGIFFIIAHLLKPDSRHSRHKWHYVNGRSRWRHYAENAAREEEVSGNFFKTNVFSYGKYFVIDTVFNGGIMKAVFSSMELDLRRAVFPEGETVLLIEAVFSSVTIFLPDDVCVDSKMDIVAGGLHDERRIKNQTGTKKIVMEGSAVFSGIELI